MTVPATTQAGDGHARWSASAYVEPLAAAPQPARAELGVLPHRWRYRDLRRLSSSGELAGTTLALVNPGLAGPARTTRTMTCAVTWLGPGTRPRARPASVGVRVVLDGRARSTPSGTVARGDVVRLREGEWQADDAGVLWFDASDLPLVSAISPERVEQARCRERSSCTSPCRLPRVHRWAQTEAVLAQATLGGSFPAIARLGAPRPGGDVTPTLRVEAHRLHPGRRTPSVRASASAVAVVLAGRGASVVGGWRVRWERGDVFVVPPGAPVDHQADVMSDLLLVSDAPALRALGLLWSETDPDHQPIEHTLE